MAEAGRVRPLAVPAAVTARIVTAALAAAMGAIHLHLWSVGYRHIHIIGILFLLNGIGASLLAVALLLAPTRLVGGVAALGTAFTAGTLVGLILSLTIGLFGFKDFTGSPFVIDTLAVESAGTLLTGLVAAVYARTTIAWLQTHRRSEAVAGTQRPRPPVRIEDGPVGRG